MMRTSRLTQIGNFLWAGLFVIGWTCSTTFAQQTEVIAKYVPVLLQGKEIKLPEDFVARLDGDRLKVALKSFGLAERHPDRDLLVSLIQDDGSSVEMRPDENGEMTFENVKEGLASLVVGSGKAAYAAMALYAIPGVAERPAKAYEVPVATVDERQVRDGVETAGTAPPGAAASKFTDYAAGAVNRFKVYLQSDGTLTGRVIVPEEGFERLAASVDLSFFRDGALVAKTTSAADGAFAVAGLTPGIHSVFASGPPGHAAFAFEVLPPKGNDLPFSANGKQPAHRFVATANNQAAGADELIVLIIPPRLMPAVRQVVMDRYPFSASSASGLAGAGPVPPGVPLGGAPMGGFPGVGGLPGGSFGGGGGGGFSGGGGGGGLGAGGLGGIGGLLGLAGLAVGVASIADDDDDGFNVNVATPINN